MLHSGVDDYGLGGNADSLITGNAGSRLACGTIQEYDDDDSASYLALAAILLF